MNYEEHILSLLPSVMQAEGNATNIKKILKVFAKYLKQDKADDDTYSLVFSSEYATGALLDLLADMFYVYRKEGETDDQLRKRIASTLLRRKKGNTIPDIKTSIDLLVGGGRVQIGENIYGQPACVYLVGDATIQEYNLIFDLVSDMLPAGVKIVVPVIRLGRWQDILDLTDSWNDLKESKYIW